MYYFKIGDNFFINKLNQTVTDLVHLKKQNEKLRQSQNTHLEKSDEPNIYLITPTYARHTQKADLTRLLYTLMHVRNLHWVLIEDSDSKTSLVSRKCFCKTHYLKKGVLTRLICVGSRWRQVCAFFL